MKKTRLATYVIPLLIAAVTLTACADMTTPPSQTDDGVFQEITDGGSVNTPDTGASVDADTAPGDFDLSVSDRDTDASYGTVIATVTFSDTAVTISGTGVSADGTAVTISQAGTYILTGSCADGSVTVNIPVEDKAQIVLDGLSLTAKNGAPLVIEQADKVFLTLAENTINTLSDAADYTLTAGDSTVDAAIFSKEDLTINGTGSLTVNGSYKHGIVSKDDLVITGGTITVTAASTAIDGKDSVRLTGDPVITVNAGTNGIRSTNAEDPERGYVWIDGGTVTVNAGTDGIEAVTLLRIDGGAIKLATGGGSANASTTTDGGRNVGWGMWGGYPGYPGGHGQTTSEDSASAKALKSTGDIMITDGVITIDSSDDAIHANANVTITGGTITAASGDDGIHADTKLTITGGDITVTKSYEGLEATDIVFAGGRAYITASDDGLNAAGGNDGSSFGGGMGRPGQNPFSGTTGTLTIAGGYLIVNAAGDGVDSNGTLTVTGGVTLVSGPTNSGNGALDYQSGASITGGTFIACGASGMAQNFSDASQGCIMVNVQTQPANSPIAICDADGTVLASFTPMKAYQNIVISTPSLKKDGTYAIRTGEIPTADGFGYAAGGTMENGTVLAEIELSSLICGGGMGGFGNPGGMGGTPPGGFGGGGRPGGGW